MTLSALSENPGSTALATMTNDDLRAELSRAIKVTAAHLAHLATVWRELERRGEDLTGLKSGLWSYMPAIASGDLLPELVVKYAGYATLLTKLSRLPLHDQRRLLDDDTVTVVERRGDEWIESKRPLLTLRSAQVQQVIRDRIVSPDEQRRAARGIAERTVGRTIKDRTIERAVAERKLSFSERISSQVPLTKAEADALRAAAGSAGVPVSAMIRAALVNAGLLD